MIYIPATKKSQKIISFESKKCEIRKMKVLVAFESSSFSDPDRRRLLRLGKNICYPACSGKFILGLQVGL